MTEPCVGAWVWASGSQVWNGNIGTLMPKPMNMPPKISTCVESAMSRAATRLSSWRMSNVSAPVRKYSARKLTIISAEPNSVYRKNLIDAYCRSGPPQTPIMKYIGSSTTSKNTKNRIRSWATNEPSMPVCRIRIRIRKPSGPWARGSGSTSR